MSIWRMEVGSTPVIAPFLRRKGVKLNFNWVKTTRRKVLVQGRIYMEANARK